MTPSITLQADNTIQKFESLSKLISSSSSLLQNIQSSANPSLLSGSSSPMTAVVDTSITINNLANLDKAFNVNITTAANWSKSLQDHSSATSDAFTNFTSKTSASINNLLQFGTNLTSLIANYKTLQSLNMAANIGQTGSAISSATTATRLLGVATKAVPWLAAIGAVLSLGEAIYTLVINTDGATLANKRLKASIEDLEKDTASEDIILNQLFKSLRNAEEGSEKWFAIRETINQKYGNQLQYMQLEINNTNDAIKAYRHLSDAIKETARQKALEKAISTAKTNYASTEAEPLQDIYDDLTKKHGNAKGVDYYVQIRDAIRRGETFPSEIQQIIKGFQIQIPTSRNPNGERTPTYSNSFLKQIQQLQEQNKTFNAEIDEINNTYGKLKQAEENNNKRHEADILQQYKIRKKIQTELKDYVPDFLFRLPFLSPEPSQDSSSYSGKPSVLFPAPGIGKKTVSPITPRQTGTDTTIPPAPLLPHKEATDPIGKAIKANSLPSDIFNGTGATKTVNVTIGNLIDKFQITAGNLQESTDRMREMVASVLIDAVNDLNTAI